MARGKEEAGAPIKNPGPVVSQLETTAARYPSSPPMREAAAKKTAAPLQVWRFTRGS